ncbi:hypothetical protein GCM10011515_13920 [Tsuneonella deserti]|uniref:DUF1489 family protein n=1 Tax=Tsuneonella deserti TaxID=2035528 RepID=A0ABQ1S8R2_9SPHN|nr:DUF1489 family protein [Tsuneonella deserti]GGD95291.1 hypothetical protein GCM10011515_13920 [Tsuneonella deserti]
MPLHMTKIAYSSKSIEALREWVEAEDEAHMRTRYLPKRHAEMIGGSLYWIMDHAVVARCEILGFAQRPDGHWTIRLQPRLILVEPKHKRAHQGWRYLQDRDAPRDLEDGEVPGDAIPGRLAGRLTKLGLI